MSETRSEALERLKTEAERWIACVTTDGSRSGVAAREVRHIVGAAHDLGIAYAPTPSSAGSASSADSQRAVAEKCAEIVRGELGRHRGTIAAISTSSEAIDAYAATLPAAPKDAPKDREEPK